MSAAATDSRPGLSLVKGPVAIVGVLGIAMGVAGLIFGGHSFTTHNIPHGAVYGKLWLGISLNGWTNLLFIAAGLLLLLGSSMHWGAKTSAFIVAGVLGAAAVIAVIRGNGVFGIFAANHRTEIVWGAAAVVLVLLSMLPRVGGSARAAREPAAVDDRGEYDDPAGYDDRGTARTARGTRQSAALDDRAEYDERATGDAAGTVRDPADATDPDGYDERATGGSARAAREPAAVDDPGEYDERATGGSAGPTREPITDDEPITHTRDRAETDDGPAADAP